MDNGPAAEGAVRGNQKPELRTAAAGSWHRSFCAGPPKPCALRPGSKAPFPLFSLKVQLEEMHFKPQVLLFLMGKVLPAHCLKHKDSERKGKRSIGPLQACAWCRHRERALGAGQGSLTLPGARAPRTCCTRPAGIKKPLPHTTQSQSPRGAQ